jgi:hypothetical protein
MKEGRLIDPVVSCRDKGFLRVLLRPHRFGVLGSRIAESWYKRV